MKKSSMLLPLLCFYRIISIRYVESFFVPDEYWQSLEVAHKLVFNYGYLTWEWRTGIRSYLYPMFFAALYQVLPNSPDVVVFAPRIFQALLSAVGDFYTYKLSRRLHGESASRWTLFAILTSWFLFYCSTRTLTNMTEASLTSIAFYYYSWNNRSTFRKNSLIYMIPVGISVMVRPTTVIIWGGLYIRHLYGIDACSRFVYIKRTFLICVIFVMAQLCIDCLMYQKFVFTPFEFFRFNWSYDIGSFYGCHSMHWYFLIGLPVVMATHFVPFILGVFSNKTRQLYYVILYFLIVLSLISHKEFRFVLPILPLCFCIVGYVLSGVSKGRFVVGGYKVRQRWIYLISSSMVVFNFWLAAYIGQAHQVGVMKAMSYLRETVKQDSSVLFLTPCHSFPYYSHIHKNITMKFLTCEPNLTFEKDYVDEADEFYQDPLSWMESYFHYIMVRCQSVGYAQCPLPSHIVMFDKLYPTFQNISIAKEYHSCFWGTNAHFDDPRTGKSVYVLCRYMNRFW